MGDNKEIFKLPKTKGEWQELASLLKADVKSNYSVRDIMEAICKVTNIRGYNSKTDAELRSIMVLNLPAKMQVAEPKLTKKESTKTTKNVEEKESITKQRGRPKKTVEPKAELAKDESKPEVTTKEKPSKGGVKIQTAKVEVDTAKLADATRQHYISECARLGIVVDPASRIEWVTQELKNHAYANPENSYREFDRAAYMKEHYGVTESAVVKSETSKEQPQANPHGELEGDALLAALRKECDELGVAYGKHHSAEQLEQVLKVVRSREQKVSTEQQLPVPQIHAPQQIYPSQTHNIEKPQAAPKSEEQILQEYGSAICSTVNGHFRKLTVAEIVKHIGRGQYPFTYEILRSANPSQIQIKLTMNASGKSQIFPSESTFLDIFA